MAEITLSEETINWISKKFIDKLNGYTLEITKINDKDRIVIVNDSLVLYIAHIKHKVYALNEYDVADNKNSYLSVYQYGDEYTSIYIEELTYNEIGFKHNHTRFMNEISDIINYKYASLYVEYKKFKGYTRPYWNKEEPMLIELLNNEFPEIKLRDRYETWKGIHYYFVIIMITDINHIKHFAVGYTTRKPNEYVRDFAEKFIKTGINKLDSLRSAYYPDLIEALNSWTGIKRQRRLEEHLTYCAIERFFREKDDVWRYADKLVKDARDGLFDEYDYCSYLRPSYRWINEEQVFKIVKKMFEDYIVIHQYRPFFLKSSNGGQMSYDVFVNGLNFAFEYQGKQHFEPVDFFGGKKAYEMNKKRDEEKRLLSKKHGIKLIYINYDEEVSSDLIKKKVNHCLNKDN